MSQDRTRMKMTSQMNKCLQWDAISGAFKSMGKGKRKADQKIELQKRNFKLRVLDLVEIFMKRNSKSPNQFLFVKPLLKCARAKTESPLSQKAGKMVSKVMPSEKSACRTCDLDEMKGLCEFLLRDMMKSHSTKYSTVLHETFLYILRSMRATLSEKDDNKLQNQTYQKINSLIAPKLENLMTQSSSKMSVKFFQDVCQRYPEFMLASTESILKFTSTAINGYRKTIASDLLLKMAKSGSLPQNFKFSFDDQTLPNALKAILAAPKTKKESIASTSANLLRFTIRITNALSECQKNNLKSCIQELKENNDMYQQKQDLISTSNIALKELGIVTAVKTKETKEAERQARRDAKRAKKAEKEERFKKIMEEKKASGEWVEKTKWKSMERKAAVAKKSDEIAEEEKAKLNKAEETKETEKMKKRKNPNRKRSKKNNRTQSESSAAV